MFPSRFINQRVAEILEHEDESEEESEEEVPKKKIREK